MSQTYSNSRGIPIIPTVRTGAAGSDVRYLIIAHNHSVRAQSMMMPGILLTDSVNAVGTSSTLKWGIAAFSFMWRGKTTAAAATEKVFTGSTHDLAQNKQAWYVLSVQTDGSTFTITKAADQTIGTNVYPTIPDNEVAVGWLKLVAQTAGGTWVGNTDTLVVGTKLASITFVNNPQVFLIGDESGAEINS